MALNPKRNDKKKLPAPEKEPTPERQPITKKEFFERWLTPQEMMAFLKLSKSAFYKRLREGLPHSKWGDKTYIDVEDVHFKLLQNKTQFKERGGEEPQQ